MMEYSATGNHPVTGNIALELLKQTQNTKYLLGQDATPTQHQAPPSGHNTTPPGHQATPQTTPPNSAHHGGYSNIGVAVPMKQEGRGGRDETYAARRKDSAGVRKPYKKHLDSSPLSSNNSSPRSSHKYVMIFFFSPFL